MAVIEQIKNILGYTGDNLDWLFAIMGVYLIFMFIQLFFALFKSAVGWK